MQAIPPKTREAVRKACQKLGYTPRFVPAPVTGKTGNIAYIIPRNVLSFASNSYYHRFFEGVNRAMKEKDYDFFLVTLKEDEMLPAILRKKKVDGLIVEEHVNKKWVKEVSSVLPIVLLNFTLDGVNVDSVMPNNCSGIKKAVFYLYQLGHRKIAFFGMKPLSFHTSERLNGYLEALKISGLSKRKDYIKMPERKRGGMEEVEEFAMEALKSWRDLALPPTAVVTMGDVYALPLLQVARELRVPVPEKLSVIGYDNTRACLYSHPFLTSIDQPMEEMGKAACQLLFERVKTPDRPNKKVVFDVDLVKRESCSRCS